MRIVDQEVEVLYPRSLEEGNEELKKIEIAGRNCWRSEGKATETSYRDFAYRLMARGHGSPLEFGAIMFRIVTGRDVLAELTRHRIGVAFAAESQRYVNEAKDEGGIKFIRPTFWLPSSTTITENADIARRVEASICWEYMMSSCENYYNHLIRIGMRNEDARKVLPNSTACQIMMACNLRSLLHIYSLRSAPAAYPEMR